MDSEGYSVRVAYWVPDNYIHERNRTNLIQKIDERRYAALQDVLMAIITFALVAIFSWIVTVEISAYASIVVALYPVVTTQLRFGWCHPVWAVRQMLLWNHERSRIVCERASAHK